MMQELWCWLTGRYYRIELSRYEDPHGCSAKLVITNYDYTDRGADCIIEITKRLVGSRKWHFKKIPGNLIKRMLEFDTDAMLKEENRDEQPSN